MLPEFDLLTPESLPQALAILSERGSGVQPIAGGTNVIVSLRDGAEAPPVLMDVSRISELRGIRQEDGHVVVGGCCTIASCSAIR